MQSDIHFVAGALKKAGIFSGGLVIRDDEVDYTEVLLNPEAFRKQFHMLFVACGKQEWSYESTVKNEKEVLAAGVPIDIYTHVTETKFEEEIAKFGSVSEKQKVQKNKNSTQCA